MNRSAARTIRPPRHGHRPEPRTRDDTSPAEPHFTYGRLFWLAYLANAVMLAAVALLFRYADFVMLLGGTEFHLGWIVGVGMVGSFSMRLLLGTWIDRYGTRLLWLGSLLLFIATCFAHLAFVGQVGNLSLAGYTGIGIYLLRISYCCAVAGVNGASMTFISMRGPKRRLAELVGMLGTAGFMGTVAGTLLGDFLIDSIVANRTQVVEMFVVAGLLGIVALPFAWAATRGERGQRGEERGEGDGGHCADPSSLIPHPSAPSLFTLLRRHNPGMVLAIGVAMGVGLGLPTTFLRTYAADLGIPRIGLFFLVYAVAAIITRVLTRRWPERFGPRRIILVGMAGMVASLALFLLVEVEWQLIVPAIGFGCSHAVLFPSVVAAGSVTFPLRHRGLATVLVLATWDLGLLVGSPTAGAILKYSPVAGLPPYPTMFLSIAALLAMVGICYAITSRARAGIN